MIGIQKITADSLNSLNNLMQKLRATKRHGKNKKTVKPSNRHEKNRLGIVDIRLSFLGGAMVSLW